MARKKRKNHFKGLRDLDFEPPRVEMSLETKRGIIIVLLFTLGLLIFLSLVDLAGTFGVYVNNFLQLVFGAVRWYLPLVLIMVGYYLLRPLKYGFKPVNFFGLVIFIFSFNGLIHLVFHSEELVSAAKAGLGGGYIGVILAWFFLKIMGFWAALILLLALSLIGFILLFETSFSLFIQKRADGGLEKSTAETEPWRKRISDFFDNRRLRKIRAKRERLTKEGQTGEQSFGYQEQEEEEAPFFSAHEVAVEQAGKSKAEEKTILEDNQGENEQLDLEIKKPKPRKIDLPLTLLNGKTTTPKAGDIKANKLIIGKTLENFGINVEMGEAQVGPTVTQYTLKPAEGVKLSRITALSDNLALALAAHPIRIEAPIPGRSLIGIEVPNQATAIVPLNEIINSEQFKNRKSNLVIALGKDVMGRPWLAELTRMPHLLIAGATGSGKSVSINSIIITLLFQNGPGDLKFIMVDPKRVELPIYNGIPHLLTPVITDVKKTINALRWAIKEMEKRFDTLSAAHQRNVEAYNASTQDKMPYIVFIIDELADLMASAGAEVEAAIVRLAQMSRAVGIHLILATQRPSVDVITGLIKANITSRVAFSVASLVDSRTILDMSGAEKLLGRGDMLYISADISKPKRLQGAFTSDEEIKNIVDFLKNQSEPDYIEAVVEKQQAATGDFTFDETGDGDPLLPEAKEVIARAKKASASLLQRRLRIGYARAARILDLLEEQGVIGPGDGAKPREVLISSLDSGMILDSENEDQKVSDFNDDED